MVMEDSEVSRALAYLSGHHDQAVKGAFLGLCRRVDELIAEVGALSVELERLKESGSEDQTTR
jgi:hypothetical protein